MQVNQNTSPAFSSRNPQIRYAQKVCSIVKSEFPAISNTKVCLKEVAQAPEFYNLIKNLGDKVEQLRAKSQNAVETFYYRSLMNSVKEYKVANCGDLSDLSEIVMRLNGFKNCGCFNLYTNKGRDLYHTVAAMNLNIPQNYKEPPLNGEIAAEYLLKPSRKTIIIDPFFEIVDYADNAILNYKNLHQKFFNLASDEKILFLPEYKLDVKDGEMWNLRKDFPNLVMPKKISVACKQIIAKEKRPTKPVFSKCV